MEKIKELLEIIKNDKECKWSLPKEKPMLPDGLILPNDLAYFYATVGNLILFPNADFPLEIVYPNDFVRANPIIANEDWDDDITYDWFIIGKSEGSGGQYVTIDLGVERLGFCYDSYWDKHVNFESPIIAKSFTEFLENAYKTKGKEWYWAEDDFQDYGMSHDDLEPLN